MVKSTNPRSRGSKDNGKNSNKLFQNIIRSKEYKRLASMGRNSVNIINELSNPVDAINRFINLALQNMEDDSQGRQFLLESKSGIRKMTGLLKKLNCYADKMEKEIRNILGPNE